MVEKGYGKNKRMRKEGRRKAGGKREGSEEGGREVRGIHF